MTHDEMLEVIQAHKDGKAIQYKHSNRWYDLAGPPSWDFSQFKYRVKPEPRTIYVNEYEETGLSTSAWPTKETALDSIGGRSDCIATRKFVEVVE